MSPPDTSTPSPTSAPTVCPPSELEIVLYAEKQNWTWHQANAVALGCVFGSINNVAEQLFVQDLIYSEYGKSGQDFVWFGAIRVDGEVPPVGQSPPGGFNSTWEWIDGSGMFGAGPSKTAGGYQNWTANEPNNNAAGYGGWGNYAGINTAAVSPTSEVYGWGDMAPGMKWAAIYKCCPTVSPSPTPEDPPEAETPSPTPEVPPPETETPYPTSAPSSSPTVCPPSELEIVLYAEKQNWTWHQANAVALGCVFGSINNVAEQLFVQDLIYSEYGKSGQDFVWFGAIRVDGEVPPVGQSPPGGFNSTWEWIDGSGMFGAGPSKTAGGYQNWTANEPNNNAAGYGGWGNYAGINTAAVSPTSEVYGWGDMAPGMKWAAIYKCCPSRVPGQEY